jgi:hypothetical protein
MNTMTSCGAKRGFGGNAPNKLWPVLQIRGVSLRGTRAVGTAKSLWGWKAEDKFCWIPNLLARLFPK